MKKICSVLCAVAFLTAFSACQKKASDGTESITFWYNNSGDEAKVYEEAIALYNASQSKYHVEGLSVTDQQKLLVALSSNEAPDVAKGSNSQVMTYQSNSLVSGLQSFIANGNFDKSQFSDASIAANTIDGELYALPLSGYSIQLYYNKDLLAAAGYTNPPETVEQMYEMGVTATQLDANGNIEVLGYPIAPLTAARQELIYAYGGRWWATDGKTLTPQDKGVIASLAANQKYRNLYGIDKVYAFTATANTNRYTENDIFFAGKQLFRLDGAWLPTMMAGFNSTVNWGITLVPSPAANPEGRGTSRFETDSVFIPVTAAHKDGAWDFIRWLSGPVGVKILHLGTGSLPAQKSLYTDADLLAKPGFPEFIDSLKLERGIQYAQIGDFSEYVSMINEHVDYVYAGKMTAEQAAAALADRAKTLK